MEGVRRGVGTRGSVRAAGRRGDVSGPDTLLHWGKGEQGNLGLVWVVSLKHLHPPAMKLLPTLPCLSANPRRFQTLQGSEPPATQGQSQAMEGSSGVPQQTSC